jgi:outer membrane lipoprotein
VTGAAIALLSVLLVAAGCATPRVPQAVRERPTPAVRVAQVQQAPERFLGMRVRWGGTVLAVHNRELATEIEILSRPLGGDGEPQREKPGEGRFLALLPGFADPAELPRDRLLTVIGRLQRVQTRRVGEYPYPYPVVVVEGRHLWPERPDPPPWYWDPWYSPWYRPWHPWHRPWYW